VNTKRFMENQVLDGRRITMKHYPSISKEPRFDGSCIRAEYSPKKGFSKFGSRKVLIGEDALLAGAIPLIQEHEEALGRIFLIEKYERVICFFEYWGEQSFAGQHVAGDQMNCTLIDIDVFKRGQIDPRDFEKLFGHLPNVAPCLASSFTGSDAALVKTGDYPGQTFEGVVVKVPATKRWQLPFMFKSKSTAWIDKVKALHGANAEKFL